MKVGITVFHSLKIVPDLRFLSFFKLETIQQSYNTYIYSGGKIVLYTTAYRIFKRSLYLRIEYRVAEAGAAAAASEIGCCLK